MLHDDLHPSPVLHLTDLLLRDVLPIRFIVLRRTSDVLLVRVTVTCVIARGMVIMFPTPVVLGHNSVGKYCARV